MKEISVEELKTYFLDTLNHCTANLLYASDEDISHNIFEEFDIGLISFLHEDSLNRLYYNKIINRTILNKSLQLREMALKLQDENKWNITLFRKELQWKELLNLSDDIKKDYYNYTSRK